MVVVCGLVLGISINDVIPPAKAALDSVSMVALWVNPGSLKCTWSSITPGSTYFPSASITFTSDDFALINSLISFIYSPSIKISPLNIVPSLTIRAFFMRVVFCFIAVLLFKNTAYFHGNDTKNSFRNNAFADFGFSFGSICKYNRYFNNFQFL